MPGEQFVVEDQQIVEKMSMKTAKKSEYKMLLCQHVFKKP
jgi:hypothetical protein